MYYEDALKQNLMTQLKFKEIPSASSPTGSIFINDIQPVIVLEEPAGTIASEEKEEVVEKTPKSFSERFQGNKNTIQSSKVERTDKIIRRKDVKENPKTLYLFGDNDVRRGLGGQAKEMRGEPNSVGISIKKLPANSKTAFKTDEEFEKNAEIITEDVNKAIEKFKEGGFEKVIIPPIGIGLAKLQEKAPKTWEHLQNELNRLEKEVNTPTSSK